MVGELDSLRVDRARLSRLVESGQTQRRIAKLLRVSKGTVAREAARLRARQAA